MTLLTAVNEVCDVVSLDQFASVYGSDDPNAQTMVALAQEAGDEIARRADWQRMLATHTAAGSPENLPTDYQRMTPGGAVRASTGDFFRPVTNSSQWAVIVGIPSIQPYFFVKGQQILFSPAASAAGAMVEYVSKNWVALDPSGAGSTFASDGDTTLFPERLLIKGITWRWKRQKGLAYEDELAEFEADLVQEINADRGVA
uniref:phage adaptor protein n=1 Tax=Ensifer adhaerens TaxID=106592 RepID=UPI003F4944C0